MDLAQVMKELWRLRLWVAVVAIVAVLIALASAYKISGFPPSLNDKTLDLGAARTQVLVDSPNSSLPNLDKDIGRLTARAGVFASFALTTPVRNEIAKRAKLPTGMIVVDTGSGNDANAARSGSGATPAQTGAGNRETRTNDLTNEGGAYRIRFNASQALPVISITTEGPNGREAVRLAKAASEGLIASVERLEKGQQIPASSRATLSRLGEPLGADVATGTNVRTALLTFVAAFGLLIVLILVASNIHQSWRRSDIELEEDSADVLSSVDWPVPNGGGNGFSPEHDQPLVRTANRD